MFAVAAASLAPFVAASAALVAVPGPAVTTIVSRGLEQGRRAALVTTLGIESGALVLVLLGIARLRGERPDAPAAAVRAHGSLFRQAFLINLMNPKLLLIFVVLIPQFVERDERVAPQVLMLGLLFVAIATVIDG